MNSLRSLSVVLPVLNERENLEVLLNRLDALRGTLPLKEVVVVDDGSTDGTLEFLEALQDIPHDYSLRVVSRTTRQGPVNACIIGSQVATSDWIVVMDADLQHPPEAIASMLATMNDQWDVTVGSRYVRGGSLQRPLNRGLLSRGAMILAHLLLPVSKRVADPMSGFFLVRRSLVADLRPLPDRCKLLLFILAVHSSARVKEVGFDFGERRVGESKLVQENLSFLPRYLIELVTYMKVRDSADSRFVTRTSGSPAQSKTTLAR
jgi:dolichol-phosphate mannosyltransferase